MVIQSRELVKNFDLFSKPFVFFIGDKQSKSTFIGGLLSLSIITVAILYLYYLLNLYLSGKIEPKITQSIVIENDLNTITLGQSFFFFEMIVNGEPLNIYEKRVGKKYFSYSMSYNIFDESGTDIATPVNLVHCSEERFIGYLCMDESFLKSNTNLYSEPIRQRNSAFSLLVQPCNRLVETNCASAQEIYNLAFRYTNFLQIFIRIQEYNSVNREYNDSFKQEYYQLDPQLFIFSRLSLIKSNTSVIDGLIMQSSTSKENIKDFKRTDTYLTLDNIQERYEFDSGFVYLNLEVDQQRNVIAIQHAMITEILAQFMGIFNSMLTVGILARMFAQTHIVQDMNNILLKEYYKKTAFQLVLNKHKKGKMLKQQKYSEKQTSEIMNSSAFELGELNGVANNQSKKQNQLFDSLVSRQKLISDTDFAKSKDQYFKMSYYQRLKFFLSQIIGNTTSPKTDSLKTGDEIIYRNLLQKSMKRINIFEVYKDIIKLKMAIKLILTKDQYAASLYCGSEIQTDSSQQKQIPLLKDISRSADFSREILPIDKLTIKLNSLQFQAHQDNFTQLSQSYPTQENSNSQIQQEKEVFRCKCASLIPSSFYKSHTNDVLSQYTSLLNCNKPLDIPIENKQQKGENYIQFKNNINIENTTVVPNSNAQLNIINSETENLNSGESQAEKDYQIKLQGKQKQNNYNAQQNVFDIQNQGINLCLKTIESPKKIEQSIQLSLYPDEVIESQLNRNYDSNIKEGEKLILDNLDELQSHLTQIDQIEEDPVLQQHYLKLFFERMRNVSDSQSSHLSYIDQQIFSSLISSYQIIDKKQNKQI